MSALLLGLVLAGCGDDDGDGPAECPALTEPQAQPGDPIDGDTYATFAAPLFQDFCTRCHSSFRTGDQRNGAPIGLNWDDEASVRANLVVIRNAVGVQNFMPLNAPFLSCAERQRLVRWIDADAP